MPETTISNPVSPFVCLLLYMQLPRSIALSLTSDGKKLGIKMAYNKLYL